MIMGIILSLLKLLFFDFPSSLLIPHSSIRFSRFSSFFLSFNFPFPSSSSIHSQSSFSSPFFSSSFSSVPCSSASSCSLFLNLFLVPPFPHLHSSVSLHFHSIYPTSCNSPLFLFTVVNSSSLPSLAFSSTSFILSFCLFLFLLSSTCYHYLYSFFNSFSFSFFAKQPNN